VTNINLYNFYQKSSVWCFAFSHTSTFELIPAVATAQPGALVTVIHILRCFEFGNKTVVVAPISGVLRNLLLLVGCVNSSQSSHKIKTS